MSWVVKLEDELGERGDWVVLHGVVPDHEEREFPILRCIDPYGRTVFNHLQMVPFLEEWERVKDRARDDSQAEAWRRIRQMAETCRKDRDLYLKFIGN
jgi:hypothetical protein